MRKSSSSSIERVLLYFIIFMVYADKEEKKRTSRGRKRNPNLSVWNVKSEKFKTSKIQCFWNAEPWSSVLSPCTVIGEWQLKELLIPVWFKCWPWKEHIAVPNLSWAGIRMCSVECNPGDGLMACSPWVRNVKKQAVRLGILAATLGLRSVPYKLHPLLGFMDQTWLL